MRRASGFTLIEILVVLVILLTGLSVLSSLLGTAMRQSVEAEEKTSIQLYCQNRLNRILSGELPVQSGMTELIDDYPEWQLSVWADTAPIPELVRIRITAQKYEKVRSPSPNQPGVFIDSDVPIIGQHLVIAQWVRREMVRMVQTKADGSNAAVGTLSSPPVSSFASSPEDPFAAGGFGPEKVFVPEEEPGEVSEQGGSVTIGGDPISDSLLERAKNRRKGAE